jgi:methionyl-tRNA formyltransferase
MIESNKKIVILAGKGMSTNILFHALLKDFGSLTVIEEEPISQSTFLKRRIKNLGVMTVFGQILFKILVVPVLEVMAQRRTVEISNSYQMNDAPIPDSYKVKVESVNSEKSIAALQELKPDVVVVNGTRIISKKVLNIINAKFINTHAGITPLYRGVHGGYWALANNDSANCGVTVHLVDAGIDTGNILYQALIQPGKEDNFTTYPLLQLGVGLGMLKKAIVDVLKDSFIIRDAPAGGSKLWYHPTIWQYLRNLVKLGVR